MPPLTDRGACLLAAPRVGQHSKLTVIGFIEAPSKHNGLAVEKGVVEVETPFVANAAASRHSSTLRGRSKGCRRE